MSSCLTPVMHTIELPILSRPITGLFAHHGEHPNHLSLKHIYIQFIYQHKHNKLPYDIQATFFACSIDR